MKIIIAFLLSMVIAILLMVTRKKTGGAWVAFYLLWMAVPASFAFLGDYLEFYRLMIGKIVFLVTLPISFLSFTKKFYPVGLIASGFNYSMLIIQVILTTFKMLGRLVKAFKK